MKFHFKVFTLLAVVCLLPVWLGAQGPGEAPVTQPGSANLNILNYLQKHWIVAGKVMTLQGDPIRGARVTVIPTNASGEFQTSDTDFQGMFRAEYALSADLVKELTVDVTITKKGFLKGHALIDLGDPDKPQLRPFTLRDPNEDPNLLSQADFVSKLAPRLKTLQASDGISSASEKDYARGVSEFFDRNHPDRSLPHFMKVVKRDAQCLECKTMLGLAELSSGDWDGASRNFGEAAKQSLEDPKVARAEPLLAYGVMESWRHEPKSATGYLMEALKHSPKDALAMQEIGRAQLLLENWGAAHEYLAKAIAAGAEPAARLLDVQALMGALDFNGANKQMTAYLDGRDVKNMPLAVRRLYDQVENKKKVEAAYVRPILSPKVKVIDYLHQNVPELKGLVPAKSQEQLASILTAVGKNVADYFKNFPNTVSLEQVHQEKLKHNGKVAGTLDEKYHYLCLTPNEPTGPGFSEFRADKSGFETHPVGLDQGFMLTSGFASTSLIFHPAYQPESTFRFLGQQKINDRETYVVAFAQQPAKARLSGNFKLGDNTMPTFSQGLAWIDTSTYQILRLRTDLLRPLPEVKLSKETTEIDFGEQHFKDIAEAFWLPREVTVSVDWNGKSLRNTHEYSDFKLFNVAQTNKIGKPK
jgi:tetratricopeptide (TPR) repeat protein